MSILLHHYFYTSRLAEGVDFSVVAPILETSRQRNRALQITGVLVFDGERFAQWLEGPPDAVLPLAERIVRDTRHTGFKLLCSQPAAGPRRLAAHWRAGYAEAADLDPLQNDPPVQGEAALILFRTLISRFDLAR